MPARHVGLCAGEVIGIPPDRQTAEHGKRLGFEMRKLGWQGPKALWLDSRTVKGYERPAIDDAAA